MRTNRNLITSPTNYVESGYDPDDGLVNGRWMRDTWGVVRWVQIGHAPTPTHNVCGCGARIGKAATRCRPCNLATIRENRSPLPAQLVACPTCGAKVNQQCRTSGGHPAASHKSRIVARLCDCGAKTAANKTMCDPCSQESRREVVRAAQQRYRERQREVAA